MKKQIFSEREEFTSILPEYGRRKLLTYADSIRELAESFRDTENVRDTRIKVTSTQIAARLAPLRLMRKDMVDTVTKWEVL